MSALDFHGRDGDVAILEMFHQWRLALAAANEGGIEEDTFDRRMDRLLEIERQIADAPAQGAAGLSVKAYIAAHNERGPDGEVDNRLLLSLVEEGPRFVPELAPLAEKILAASVRPEPDEPIDRRPELRARAAALAAEYRGPLPSGDAGLLEAERRDNELTAGISALSKGLSMEEEAEIIGHPATDDDDDAIDAAARNGKPGAVAHQLWKFIVDTAPEGPAGIAVKLRLLYSFEADPELTEGAILSQCIDAINAFAQRGAA